MRYLQLLVFSILVFFTSCNKAQKHPVDFYYWKSNVSIGKTEQKYFDELDSRRLYIRLFDVDLDESSWARPKAKINLFDPSVIKAEYVPVVFITNRTLQKLNEYSLESTAKNVSNLINEICEKNNIPPVSEIQIDCDWTASTKANYFTFLHLLKQESEKDISCTLRLHQIKYKDDTGIPPVDRAVLMCYATSDPTENSEKNSILDISLLKDYTSNINSYPISFDVALPLYSWGIVTNHLGQVKLVNNVSKSDMDPAFFKEVKENEYEAIDDFFFQGIYMNKGFTVKTEGISAQLLNEAKEYLDGKISNDYRIIYYHLDRPFLERFSIDELK